MKVTRTGTAAATHRRVWYAVAALAVMLIALQLHAAMASLGASRTTFTGLIDQNGDPIGSRLARRQKLVLFGFTRCASVCPVTLVKLHQVVAQLGAAGATVEPVFISVDPARDTPQVLRSYLQSFDPRIIGLTGDAIHIERIVEHFDAFVVRRPDAPDALAIEHTSRLYLISADNSVLGVYELTEGSSDIAADVARKLERTGA